MAPSRKPARVTTGRIWFHHQRVARFALRRRHPVNAQPLERGDGLIRRDSGRGADLGGAVVVIDRHVFEPIPPIVIIGGPAEVVGGLTGGLARLPVIYHAKGIAGNCSGIDIPQEVAHGDDFKLLLRKVRHVRLELFGRRVHPGVPHGRVLREIAARRCARGEPG